MNEQNDPSCLGDGEARRLLVRSPWRRVVALGEDRGVRRAEPVVGYGSACWPERVADALREVEPGVACLNLLTGRARGAAEVRSRQLPEALAFGGDLAVVQLTGRDLLSTGFDGDAFRTELVRIIAPLREHGYDVLLVGPFDLTRLPKAGELDKAEIRARQHAQAKQCRTLTLRHGALHVDLSSGPLWADGEVWSRSGTGLNSRGHALTAAAVVRALGERLRPSGSAPGPPGADSEA